MTNWTNLYVTLQLSFSLRLISDNIILETDANTVIKLFICTFNNGCQSDHHQISHCAFLLLGLSVRGSLIETSLIWRHWLRYCKETLHYQLIPMPVKAVFLHWQQHLWLLEGYCCIHLGIHTLCVHVCVHVCVIEFMCAVYVWWNVCLVKFVLFSQPAGISECVSPGTGTSRDGMLPWPWSKSSLQSLRVSLQHYKSGKKFFSDIL